MALEQSEQCVIPNFSNWEYISKSEKEEVYHQLENEWVFVTEKDFESFSFLDDYPGLTWQKKIDKIKDIILERKWITHLAWEVLASDLNNWITKYEIEEVLKHYRSVCQTLPTVEDFEIIIEWQLSDFPSSRVERIIQLIDINRAKQ